MLKLIRTPIIVVILLSSCIEDKSEPVQIQQEIKKESLLNTSFDYLPSSTTKCIYKHNSYAFSYSEKHEQSEWVAYVLEPSDLVNSKFDRPYFIQDPIVKTKSADWKNYKKSGYDKGHLCPAGDRKKLYSTFKETFYTSNISPQLHGFNSGIWNKLEDKTRYWAEKFGGLYVITGGVLSNNLKTIGKEKVAVPNYFYKILATKDRSKMIGFLVPHKNSKQPLYEFTVSVDAIEKVTGIDFFPKLSDKIENKLEATADYKRWSF